MSSEFVNNNILGSYISFDLKKGLTRKYHSFFSFSREDGTKLNVIPAINETIELEKEPGSLRTTDLSYSNYGENPQPPFLKHIERTYYLPFPSQTLKVDGAKIVREFIIDETNDRLEIKYTIDSPHTGFYICEPLFNYRDNNEIGLKLIKYSLDFGEDSLTVSLPDELRIRVSASSGKFVQQSNISFNHFYQEEQKRGYDFIEDLLKLGKFIFRLQTGKNSFSLRISLKHSQTFRRIVTHSKNIINPSENPSILSDINRFSSLYPNVDKNLTEYLIYNARKFIIKIKDRYSITAGYHWFGEWGRDTFISFKGILLALGRYHEAQKMLTEWAKYISVGLLPNTMLGLHYNTIDASLWFVQACYYYWLETNDKETILHLLPKLERMVYAFNRGSKYGIGINPQGFLVWEQEEMALTWMDAKVANIPVINRAGACIEIQALWYNALECIESMAKELNYNLVNRQLFDYYEKQIKENFENSFFDNSLGYYADYISNRGEKNTDLRPNQLLTYSLSYPIASEGNFKRALEVVERELLTKVGLRTLSTSSPNFHREYSGAQPQRDKAYHNGVIWPWLLIPYYNAISQLGSIDKIANHVDNFWNHLMENNLLHVPEIFSDKNLEAGGAIAQAWSVSALIEGIILINKSK